MMIERWLEIYGDPRLKMLTATMRVAAANGILLAESRGASPTPVTLYRAEDDSGFKSLQEMREELRNSINEWNTAPEAEIVRIYSELSGKVWKKVE